jgi:hypothetical protein
LKQRDNKPFTTKLNLRDTEIAEDFPIQLNFKKEMKEAIYKIKRKFRKYFLR